MSTKFSSENQPNVNRGGRPKMPADLRAAFQEHTPEAMQTLVDCMRDTKAKWGDRTKSAETILNRGWGTPVQLKDDGTQNDWISFINAVTDQQ